MDDLSTVIERARRHGATVRDIATAFGVDEAVAERLTQGVEG